jgi:hypothetical protein
MATMYIAVINGVAIQCETAADAIRLANEVAASNGTTHVASTTPHATQPPHTPFLPIVAPQIPPADLADEVQAQSKWYEPARKIIAMLVQAGDDGLDADYVATTAGLRSAKGSSPLLKTSQGATMRRHRNPRPRLSKRATPDNSGPGAPTFDVAGALDILREVIGRTEALVGAAEDLLEQEPWGDDDEGDGRRAERLAHLLGATVHAPAWPGVTYRAPALALSRATARTHVDTLMLAAAAARCSSVCSPSVVSTRRTVSRRSASATGGRPMRGFGLPCLGLDAMGQE